MALNASEEAAIEQRRLRAWDLRVQGKTIRQIAAALEVSVGTAHNDIETVLERTKSEADETVNRYRALELARCDRQTAVLMPMVDALDPEVLMAASAKGEDLKAIIAQAQAGLDAIDRLDKVAKRRAALLGLDAPARQELTGRDGAPIEIDARRVLADRIAGLVAGEAAGGEASEDSREPDGKGS